MQIAEKKLAQMGGSVTKVTTGSADAASEIKVVLDAGGREPQAHRHYVTSAALRMSVSFVLGGKSLSTACIYFP
jgi:hypothetical protein